ncbi:MAG: DEAD/DEAH box helicase [Planctomycetota bacterium]|nr:DEAD/DEAH box helicase [Planctomycetota bacterium]
MTASPADRRRLLQICRTLTPAETLVLQLLSVIYAPVSIGALRNVARHFHSGLSGNLPVIVESLLRKELVEKIAPDGNEAKLYEWREIRAAPPIREALSQAALDSGIFHSLAGAVRSALWRDEERLLTAEHGLARARAALYQGNEKMYREALRQNAAAFPREKISPVAGICAHSDRRDWLKNLPKNFLVEALTDALRYALAALAPADDLLTMLEETASPATAPEIAYHYLFRGKFAKVLKFAKTATAPEIPVFFRAWVDALSGHNLSPDNVPATTFPPLAAALRVLLWLKNRNYAEAEHYCERQGPPALELARPLFWVVKQRLGQNSPPPPLPDNGDAAGWSDAHPLTTLFAYLARHWEAAAFDEHRAGLATFFQQARDGGYDWLAVEAAAILAAREKNDEVLWAAKLANAVKKCKCAPVVDWLTPRAEWERPLSALTALLQNAAPPAAEAARLIWQLDYHDPTGIYELSAWQQGLTVAGKWGKGKRLAWSAVAAQAAAPFFTDDDRRLVAALSKEIREKTATYELNYDLALPALVGHPRVFLAGGARVEVVGGEPELLVLKTPDGIKLQIQPPVKDDESIAFIRETPTRFRVVKIAPLHRQLAKIIGAELAFPQAALPAVKPALDDFSAYLTVQSEVGGIGASAEEMPPEPRLRAHLLPLGDGLQVEFFARPFGDCGGYYRPGRGAGLLVGEFDGRRVRVSRDLPAEIARLEKIIAQCPALGDGERVEQAWRLSDPLDCLEFLLELRDCGDEVVAEWPQGGRRSVEASPQFSRVRVNRRNDWFEVVGEIKVNEALTISLQELLRLNATATGRFVKIGEDQFLALTASFKEQLDALSAFGEVGADGVRLSPLAALTLDDLRGEVGEFQADLAWKQLVAKLRAPAPFAPPANLRGELRDYQKRGFEWLANLAEWNFGACLADDMGLGKTVQTLALLLHRAAAGAALIVAPTSVCFNWRSEAEKFAPDLQVVRFGDGDRAAMLKNAGKNAVVVCSYALLQQEEKLLAEKEWATVVLDEAQAIKNAATKRSQAAMKLPAAFRLVTTGTPIENHLGELWNLFNFLNRGLLGSHKKFQERFAAPIEGDNDAAARERLKRLLKPFILRRLKTQVLTELPPRTEILKTLPPSPEEAAFYEAARRDAVEKLQNLPAARGAAGARHLRILAEIMRLRRACCHPRLVDPASKIMSSKMAEFGAIVEELRENGHRALVFSQFVDHLALAREYLDERRITYQYLDGATPEKQRRKAVAAFQAGAGDLFLISLKAGGQGLNLTAADYVIHLDPWWNPAAEDQASDRAHRIGQTRPVTIYRLVMQNTIEEKIVEMHRHKRRLAEGLLSDGDLGKIDAEALLQLMRG